MEHERDVVELRRWFGFWMKRPEKSVEFQKALIMHLKSLTGLTLSKSELL
jgi:hypothetical protein